MTQDEAFNMLKTGANVFLTGEPGSGKTHTVNRYVAHLRGCGVEPAVTASTGIAATHIGGMTLHSWCGIGVRQRLTPYDLDAIVSNRRVMGRVGNARVLIIDEVSMLSAQTLSMAETVCREVRRGERNGEEPFGGLQVVLVGDFFQLPPVTPREVERDNQRDLFGRAPSRKAEYAFSSHVWQKINPLVCYLSEQHRQEDRVFLEFLGAVRRAGVLERHKALLRTRYVKAPPPATTTQLYSHNADVDYINTVELGKLKEKPVVFAMKSRGPEPLVQALKKGCLSPETLSLKLGARVMFTRNDLGRRFVNGTIGVVSGFAREGGCPIVTTTSGREVTVEPQSWLMQDGVRTLAQITQIPLRLAWAITVHKSQGMSLDAAHMNLADAFEYGQGYVALSRVRALKGLSLAGLNTRALEVHPFIREEDAHLRAASDAAQKKFRELPPEELAKMQADFLRAIGGKFGGAGDRGGRKRKAPSRSVTRDFVLQGLSVEDIARRRGMAHGTILAHLEALVRGGLLDPERDLAHLKRSVRRSDAVLAVFRKRYEETGEILLAPVRELLGGSYSFDDLRLARLFLRLRTIRHD